jgi:transcriptional regulator with XRE-family HTH domain
MVDAKRHRRRSRRLPNYLLMLRKKAGLTQDEVANLFGHKSGSKISRYESNTRRPLLLTALSFEAIYGVSVRESFAGLYEQVEREIAKRARRMIHRLRDVANERQLSRKLEVLSRIANPPQASSTSPAKRHVVEDTGR